MAALVAQSSAKLLSAAATSMSTGPCFCCSKLSRRSAFAIASVWSIIAHLHVVGDDVAQVAADYALPSEAVEAAMAYYRRHKDLIDARIVANAV